MYIESIARYIVKGLKPEWLEKVHVPCGAALPFDRRFAFLREKAKTSDSLSWLSKPHLLCTMIDHSLTRVGLKFYEQEHRLDIFLDGEFQSSFDLHLQESIAALERWMTNFLRLALPCCWLDGKDQQEGNGHYADNCESYISIVNLSTLADIENTLGGSITKDRFRANIYVQDLKSWQERFWVGKTLQIGDMELYIVEEIKRCMATSVDIKTGKLDRNLPKELLQYYGHAYCGVFALVKKAGEIKVGDSLGVQACGVPA